jgi:hypothetical protein
LEVLASDASASAASMSAVLDIAAADPLAGKDVIHSLAAALFASVVPVVRSAIAANDGMALDSEALSQAGLSIWV